MAWRPAVVVLICIGLFLMLESLVPKALALSSSNINSFRMDDQNTYKTKNFEYMLKRDKRISKSLNKLRVIYDATRLEPNPEELSAFLMDKKMDDVSLDEPIEARTSKRDDIKMEDQAIPDPPCNCKYTKRIKKLGQDFFPTTVEEIVCSKDQESGCQRPFYACKETHYNLTILKKKPLGSSISSYSDNLHPTLSHNWNDDVIQISVGCMCLRDFYYTIKLYE